MRTLHGLEAAWRRGPISAQAEWLRAFVDPDEGGSAQLSGGYLQLDWILTGESRPLRM